MSKTTTLKFNTVEVRKLLAHAKACVSHAPTLEQLFDPEFRFDRKEVPEGTFPEAKEVDLTRIPFGLHLVADHGIYLMSNGHDPEEPKTSPENPARAVYAEGFNPDKVEFDTWWDGKQAAMGGDDQCLFLPGESIENALNRAKGGFIEVGVVTNGEYVTETTV